MKTKLTTIIALLFLTIQLFAQHGYVKDNQGNKYPYIKVNDEKGTLWMTQDLRVDIPGSYCYGNKSKCETRFYNYRVASKACRTLGRGWRVPSKYVWARLFAMVRNGPHYDRKFSLTENYWKALKKGGYIGLNLQRTGTVLLSEGKYLSSAAIISSYWSTAWNMTIRISNRKVIEAYGRRDNRAFSIRCVKY